MLDHVDHNCRLFHTQIHHHSSPHYRSEKAVSFLTLTSQYTHRKHKNSILSDQNTQLYTAPSKNYPFFLVSTCKKTFPLNFLSEEHFFSWKGLKINSHYFFCKEEIQEDRRDRTWKSHDIRGKARLAIGAKYPLLQISTDGITCHAMSYGSGKN